MLAKLGSFGMAAVLLAQAPDDVLIRERVTAVMAPTTVLDKDGVYVTGLKPSEFRLFDNGKPQSIKVDEIVAPISLVVAVQADAKVEAVLPKIQKLGTLFKAMVAGENGEVAILAFDHRIRTLQDFTNDPDKLDLALKDLKPGSSTSAMVDAVVEATRMLRGRAKDRRKVLLLISESRDKGSTLPHREALTNLEMHNVMVYALNMSRLFTELTAKPPLPRPAPIPPAARHVPAGAAQTPTTVGQMTGAPGYGADFAPLVAEIFTGVKALFVPNPVEVFTRYTGGKEYPFVSQRDLERAAQEIGREIHNQYLITYNPTTKEEGGFHTIRVEVARRGLEVRTRDGYWLASMK